MIGSFLVDCLALLSVVGIWPRYVEPKLLRSTRLKLNLPLSQKVKILHLTDLHYHAKSSKRHLRKILKRVSQEKPDAIFFTGDFLCYSRLEDREGLKGFLKELKAPLGTFATLGNHDYASYVSRDRKGDYVIKKPISPLKGFLSSFITIFKKSALSALVSEEAKRVSLHEELVSLLEECHIQLLHNSSIKLSCGVNVVGVGEWGLGKVDVKSAFASIDPTCPTIVLAHNPDSFPLLSAYPGEWILSGHSHGEQIHFPFPLQRLSQKLTRLEHPELSRGLTVKGGKKLYVNRGVGGHKPFRFLSPPELLWLES